MFLEPLEGAYRPAFPNYQAGTGLLLAHACSRMVLVAVTPAPTDWPGCDVRLADVLETSCVRANSTTKVGTAVEEVPLSRSRMRDDDRLLGVLLSGGTPPTRWAYATLAPNDLVLARHERLNVERAEEEVRRRGADRAGRPPLEVLKLRWR